MKFSKIVLATAALTAFAGAANAVTYSYGGTTTLAGPTFNRPLAGTPPSGLSGVGTAVHYSTLTFGVTATGSYDFLSTAAASWDNFTILYAGTFNPASALTNALVANDDFSLTIGLSGFSASLTQGLTYVLVTTGFANTDVGTFSNTITGPGNVIAVGAIPEPGTYALMALGLAGLALVRRRSANAKT